MFQNKNSDFCAPLTSFDWNEVDANLLGTSSIDTTCTIWGLEVSFWGELKCPDYLEIVVGVVILSLKVT